MTHPRRLDSAPRPKRPGRSSGRIDGAPHTLRLWAFVLCLLIGLSLALANPAEARRRRMPFYKIREVHGEVAAGLGLDSESRETTGQEDQDQIQTVLEQEINLGGSGWLYHPALAILAADFGVIFNQDFQSSSRGESTESFLNQLNYDVNLGILPYKPYPLSFFASQLRSQVNSPFAPRQVVETFRTGGGLTLRDLAIGSFKMPARASYRYQETQASSFAGVRDNTRDRHEVEFATDNKSETTRNLLRYNWKDITSRNGPIGTKSSRHDLRFSQQRRLARGELGSQFFLNNTGGTIDTLALSANEHLRLEHTRTFSSDYTYGLTYQDSRGFSVVSHTGSSNVSHVLYESLTSSANVLGSYSNSDFGTIWTAGGGGGLDYRKKIPGGSFGLRFRPQYLQTDEDVEDAVIPITETHPVQDTFSILLKKPPIDGTLKVTSEDGATTYDLNTDYTVADADAQGLFKTIRVVPGSPLMTNETTMSVQYSYRTEPSRKFTTVTLASGFSLNLWDHLTVDVSHTHTDQTLLQGKRDQFSLDDTKRLLALAEFRYRNTRTRFEYERLWSLITPRERFSLSHDVSFRPTRLSTLGAGAGYDRDRITDVDRLTQAVSFNLTGGIVLPYRIVARGSFLLRWLDQPEQDSLGATSTITLSYQYGRLRFNLQDRLNWRQTDSKLGVTRKTDEIINTLFFRVERPF